MDAGISVDDLNALVGSRICHDLISPLGAISNGVELLNMSGLPPAPEIALIAQSIDNANARIRFFRVAFGAASNDAMFSRAEAVSILEDVFKGSRTTIEWRIREDARRADVKLAFLLVQCLESALPWGGEILITKTDDCWHVSGRGERLRIVERLWDLVSEPGPSANVLAADVHFALVPQAAAQVGRPVTAKISEQTITLSF